MRVKAVWGFGRAVVGTSEVHGWYSEDYHADLRHKLHLTPEQHEAWVLDLDLLSFGYYEISTGQVFDYDMQPVNDPGIAVLFREYA